MFFLLTNGGKANIINDVDAGLAHLVERHLAKVEVASSSLVTRSRSAADKRLSAAFFVFDLRLGFDLELRLAFYLEPCMAGKLCGLNPCGSAWCGRYKQKEIERRLLRFLDRGRRCFCVGGYWTCVSSWSCDSCEAAGCRRARLQRVFLTSSQTEPAKAAAAAMGQRVWAMPQS